MNENFISSTIKIFSSNAEGILNLFKERLSVQNDNFKDQKNFGKLINDNIASKVRMNIKSDDWLKGNNNPDWCIVSDIHLDLNQIDLMSADNKYSFNNMAPCLTALLYIYHECNLKDEKMQIETRSQDNNLSFAEAEFVTGKLFYGTSLPIIKKKTWWDSTIRKDWKGDTLQSEEEKHGMKNIHGELIPHIQNIFFNEQKEVLKK